MTCQLLAGTVLVGSVLVLGACEPAPVQWSRGEPSPRGCIALGEAGQEHPAWADLDGAGPRWWMDAPVTGPAPQRVVATGLTSGDDQGKVIVFDFDGRRALEYVLPTLSPFPLDGRIRDRALVSDPEGGGCLRQAVTSDVGLILPLEMAGRRFLVIGANGRWAPSSFVVLEILGGGRFMERLVFWNYGTVRRVFHAGDRVGFLGVNNDLDNGSHREDLKEQYTSVLAVFDLRALSSADFGRPVLGRCPLGNLDLKDVGSAYEHYVRLPVVQSLEHEPNALPIESDGRILVVDGRRNRIFFDPRTGVLTATDTGGTPLRSDQLEAPQHIWSAPRR